MVDVNGTVHHLRKDICTLGIGYHNFACPHNGEVILKVNKLRKQLTFPSFSPRNGEVILKLPFGTKGLVIPGFSPRNGEVILKGQKTKMARSLCHCFSPRNGEVILKL